jgi:proteasome lid subunit RPN8/RPN11
MIGELGRRGEGRRETGAFLLAPRSGNASLVAQVVYLDDLDPNCLVGSIHLHGEAYSKLWSLCDREGMRVVGDIHTHPGTNVGQSRIDAANPMVARRGHLALIAPDLASRFVATAEIGVHEYRGDDGWESYFGRDAKRVIYVGRWA